MPREKAQEAVLEKLRYLQEGNSEPVWISGTQLTELIRDFNPSSIRMALLLLVESGQVQRERRAGRGKRGKTGQSAWYSLVSVEAELHT